MVGEPCIWKSKLNSWSLNSHRCVVFSLSWHTFSCSDWWNTLWCSLCHVLFWWYTLSMFTDVLMFHAMLYMLLFTLMLTVSSIFGRFWKHNLGIQTWSHYFRISLMCSCSLSCHTFFMLSLMIYIVMFTLSWIVLMICIVNVHWCVDVPCHAIHVLVHIDVDSGICALITTSLST